DPSSWGPRRVTWGALLLLSGDGLLRTLTGAGIGLGALAVHRESPAVAQTLLGTDLDLASDVSLDLAAQVTLDLVVALDVISEDCQLLVGEVLGTQVGTDARALQDLDGPGPSDAENVRDRKSTRLNSSHVSISYAVFCLLPLLPRCPLFPYTTLFRSILRRMSPWTSRRRSPSTL